jgi:hypothetical protein
MSPRRRGRGRHGGANGAEGPAEAGSSAGLAAAVNSGAAPAEMPAHESAPAPQNAVVYPNGYRPNGAAPVGGPATGRPGGQRRQPRSRPTGPAPAIASGPAVAPAVAPAFATEETPATEPDAEPAPFRHPSCTLAQMRRFIKSRPYVPVHELRRRFEIMGIEDEVSPVATGRGTIYVGLPPEQARYLGELIKSGDVGCEMLLDPVSPGVIGVFPMRPVARQ